MNKNEQTFFAALGAPEPGTTISLEAYNALIEVNFHAGVYVRGAEAGTFVRHGVFGVDETFTSPVLANQTVDIDNFFEV